MVRRRVRKIRVRFVISHILAVSLFFVIGGGIYLYHLYAEGVASVKARLMKDAYAIERALLLEDMDNLNVNERYAVLDRKGQVLFGDDLGVLKPDREGFVVKKGVMAYSVHTKDLLDMPYQIVVEYPLDGLRKRVLRNGVFMACVGFLIVAVYGVVVYFMAMKWLKPVEDAYINLEEFAEAFSHEVLTPISQVLFYVKDEEIRRGLLHTKDVLTGFLTLQKQQQNLLLSRERVDIGRLCSLIENEFAPLIRDRDLRIEKVFDGDTINTNAEMLYLILKNLIGNAIKYSPEHSKIEIHSRKGIRFFSIEVENRVALDGGEEQGMGFGLKVVKRAAEMLGGRFEISIGESAHARITLPLR